MAANKRTKGATKRRTPLPIKKWLVSVSKVTIVVSVLFSGWLGFEALKDVRWRPLALGTYEVTTSLVYQDEAQVKQVLDGFIGQSLMTLDLQAVNLALEELSWIRQASVLKSWPNSIEITLVEHEPVAFWNDTDVLNSEGIPLSKPIANLQLASLHGPAGKSSLVMENYLQFARIFRDQQMQVTEVSMKPRGSWTVTLGSHIKIVLGERDVLERSRRIVKIMNSEQFELEKIDYIDARYPNGVAVKMKKEISLGVENDIAA